MKLFQKIVGLIILTAVLYVLITTVGIYQKLKVNRPAFIQEQAERYNASALGYPNLPQLSASDVKERIDKGITQINKEFTIQLLLLLLYAMPAVYLLVTKKRAGLVGVTMLCLFTIINILVIVVYGGKSTDSGITLATLVVPVASILYLSTSIVVIVQSVRKRNLPLKDIEDSP